MIYLETERLILRDWKKKDLSIFIKLNQDVEVMKYFLKPLSEKETSAFYNRIQQELNQYGYGLYAVETKIEGKFIGYIGFHNVDFEAYFTPCVEISWRLNKDAWGKGYATEGAKACLDYGFKTLNFKEIYAFTSLLNQRSERVMLKIDMQKIKEFKHPLVDPDHELSRHVLYKIKQ